MNYFFDNIFVTIMTGVLVLIFWQLILELVISPIMEYRKVKLIIANKLKYFSNLICNPLFYKVETQSKLDEYLSASKELRGLSCELDVKYLTLFSFLRIFFRKDEVAKACTALIKLSNSIIITRSEPMEYIHGKSLPMENNDEIQRIIKYLNSDIFI